MLHLNGNSRNPGDCNFARELIFYNFIYFSQQLLPAIFVADVAGKHL